MHTIPTAPRRRDRDERYEKRERERERNQDSYRSLYEIESVSEGGCE